MKYLIVLFLIANQSFGQEWIKTNLNASSSIEFPTAPEKTEQNGDVVYTASDEFSLYVVLIRNIESLKLSESEIPEFCIGFLNGSLKASGGELISQNEFSSKDIIGNEMIYFTNSNPQLPNIRHKRVFVRDNDLISYEVWTFEENLQLASLDTEKFFNSISVSKKIVTETKITESMKTNSAIENGYMFGKLVFYLVAIGLVIGAIFTIRKVTKRRNKNVT